MRLAGPPAGPVRIPEAVHRLAGGREPRPIWRNELGGLAFAVGERGEPDSVFIKWAAHDSGLDLAAEAQRLDWVWPFSPAPEVVTYGNDGEGWWLVTAALDGESAVAERWLADPASAVRALGAGLRVLHESAPLDDCPFDWSVEERLLRAGLVDPGAEAPPAPSIDRLVVCHGDACSPNTLISDDGHFLAHVDFGRLGVADRWADLAVATMSAEWNYGPGWDSLLLDSYGVEPDLERTAYYRWLWNAT
jgi:kanamycin kinase